MKRLIQAFISIAIGGLLLWLSFRQVALDEAIGHLRDVPWWLYVVYVAFVMLTHCLRTERFRVQLLRMTKRPVSFGEAMALFSVGVAATFLIPFRLGEFVRPYLGKVRGHMDMSAGLSTVAAERVIDGLTTTAMLGVILLLLRGVAIPETVFIAGYVALAVFGGAFVVFVLGYLKREWTVRLFKRLFGVVSQRLADKLGDVLDRFLGGLNTLPSWKDVALYQWYTIAYWFINGASMYLVMVVMGIDVGWVGGFFVLACLVIGVMIPAPPGNVGNFEYAVVLPLTVLGVSPALAAAYAVVIHLLQALQMTGVAVFFVATGRVSLQRIVEATQARGRDDAAV